jgi:hypothetical protein
MPFAFALPMTAPLRMQESVGDSISNGRIGKDARRV